MNCLKSYRTLAINSSRNCMIRCIRFHAIQTFLIVLFITINTAISSQMSYTIKEISEAMLASEAQYSNIKLNYTANLPDIQDATKRNITKITFAQKMAEGWLYLDRQDLIEGDSIDQNKEEGDLTVFNGENTLYLLKESEPNAIQRAAIYPGREERLIKNFNNTPQNIIWGYGYPYAKIITDPNNKFDIVSQSEEINGHRVIKLSGTAFNGNGTLTLWICPQLNFMPLKTQAVRNKDQNAITRSFSDFVRLSNGLFYPQKITLWDPNSLYSATMEMTDISIDPIPESFFRPSLPPNTQVSDLVNGIVYTTTAANNLDNLGPISLAGKELPDLAQFEVRLNQEAINDKMVLISFFDIEQRPSRNCIIQLNKREQELRSQDIVIVAVHASTIEREKLDEWLEENKIGFPVGMIETEEERIRFNWGVKSLPWLMLTDENHIVTDEGFSINELDEKTGTN